ncbi:MAG: hypothetical protein OEV95_09500, partial [Gemmatimonadota bacterium]|nr:hypothetical protein [Gemmatimonadota bacterium]
MLLTLRRLVRMVMTVVSVAMHVQVGVVTVLLGGMQMKDTTGPKRPEPQPDQHGADQALPHRVVARRP